jgi:dienelactone hydrolase
VSGPPYAAVVVLHGRGGISSHSIAIADRRGSCGYVALTVDSLGPRGIANASGGSELGAGQRLDRAAVNAPGTALKASLDCDLFHIKSPFLLIKKIIRSGEH